MFHVNFHKFHKFFFEITSIKSFSSKYMIIWIEIDFYITNNQAKNYYERQKLFLSVLV